MIKRKRNARAWNKLSEDDVRKVFTSAKDEYEKAREAQREILVLFLKEFGLNELSGSVVEFSKVSDFEYKYITTENQEEKAKQSNWNNWKYIEALDDNDNYYYISFQAHDIDIIKGYIKHFLYDRIGIYKGKKTDLDIAYEKMEILNIDLPFVENGKIYEEKLMKLIRHLNIDSEKYSNSFECFKLKMREYMLQTKSDDTCEPKTFAEIKSEYEECRRWQQVKIVDFFKTQNMYPIGITYSNIIGQGPYDLKPGGTNPYDSSLLKWIYRNNYIKSCPFYFLSFQPFADVCSTDARPFDRRYLLDRIGLFLSDDESIYGLNQKICENMKITGVELPLKNGDLDKLANEIQRKT